MTKNERHPPRRRIGIKILSALLRNQFSRPVTQKFNGLFLRYFPGQITCQEFEAFVIDYHEKRLDDNQIQLFERHMRFCRMCKTSFRSYLKTIELGKKIFPNHMKEQFFVGAPRELIDAILETSSRSAKRGNEF